MNNSSVYAYDKVGNRLSTNRNGTLSTYSHGSNDRFLSGDGWSMPTGSYDANGNPTVVVGPGGSRSLVFDASNRMTRLTFANGTFNAFRYNGDGVRVEQTNSSGTSRYVMDGAAIVAIADGANNVIEYRLSGVGTVKPTAGGGATNVYEEADIMGSTVCARDGSGAMLRRNNFDAYGRTEEVTPGAWRESQFAGAHGYVSDKDTDFDLCGARYYIPAIGRFLTRDPIGHGGGLNLYAYCENSPLTNVDPKGTSPNLAFLSSLRSVPFLRTFDTPDAAVAAVATYIWPTSWAQHREFGGFVSRTSDNRFRLRGLYQAPESYGGAVQILDRPFEAVAFWHTHPFTKGMPIPGSSFTAGDPDVFSRPGTSAYSMGSGDIPFFIKSQHTDGYLISPFLIRRFDLATRSEDNFPYRNTSGSLSIWKPKP